MSCAISARAKSGGEASQNVTIDYRPELPRTEIALPSRGQQFAEAGPVEVRRRIIPASAPTAYSIALLVNGKEVGAAQTPKLDAEELIFQTPLAAGANRLELRVQNEWGAERLSEAQPVRVVQPPAATADAGPAASDKPLVSLTAVVKSKLPVSLATVQVRVNDEPTPVPRGTRRSQRRIQSPAARRTAPDRQKHRENVGAQRRCPQRRSGGMDHQLHTAGEAADAAGN